MYESEQDLFVEGGDGGGLDRHRVLQLLLPHALHTGKRIPSDRHSSHPMYEHIYLECAPHQFISVPHNQHTPLRSICSHVKRRGLLRSPAPTR
jgi:hypothetical protein